MKSEHTNRDPHSMYERHAPPTLTEKRRPDPKIGCVIYADAQNEDKMSAFLRLGTWAANSFKYFHPDIELIAGTFWKLGRVHNNLRSDTPFKNLNERCPETYKWHWDTLKDRSLNPYGISKFKIAEELIRREKFDKIIVLGADTITCARLEHFLQEYSCYGCGHIDVDVVTTPDVDPRFPANPDVICFNARKTADGMQSKALTLTIEQWEKDFKVGGVEEMKYGEMWSLKEVLLRDLRHTHMNYVTRMPVDNLHYSYNNNKGIAVVVEDMELVNNIGVPKKLYVYHIQCGFGTKEGASMIYDILRELVWSMPIFKINEKGNRKFFQTVTGDRDMFKLSQWATHQTPGISEKREKSWIERGYTFTDEAQDSIQ